MDGLAASSPTGVAPHASAPNTISVPFVILVALLVGVGLFLISVWFLTGQWIYFSGVFAVFLGAMLMLNPRAGSDHA